MTINIVANYTHYNTDDLTRLLSHLKVRPIIDKEQVYELIIKYASKAQAERMWRESGTARIGRRTYREEENAHVYRSLLYIPWVESLCSREAPLERIARAGSGSLSAKITAVLREDIVNELDGYASLRLSRDGKEDEGDFELRIEKRPRDSTEPLAASEKQKLLRSSFRRCGAVLREERRRLDKILASYNREIEKQSRLVARAKKLGLDYESEFPLYSALELRFASGKGP